MIKRVLSLALLCFSACGYQWTDQESDRTISVPYIANDHDGALTAAIIQELSSTTSARIDSHGRYRLEMAIVQDSVDPLGFRRDPQKINGKIRKHLTQNEDRKTISVDVSLFDHEKQIAGPIRVSADVDVDYIDGDCLEDLQFQNQQGQTQIVLPFSLGQLESEESALDAAQRPLYRKIAQKVADVVAAEW